MTHKMGLATEYFEKIKNGTKTIECRLYDEKRRQLKAGEFIEFSDAADPSRKINSEIIALHRFASFEELADAFPSRSLGAEKKEIILAALRKFYSKENEEKYGVVGIEIKNVQA